MKVTTVSANIRYSQDTGHGAWKVVELGVEATLDAKETWTVAQAKLYQQLGCQLKTLWNNGNGQKAGVDPTHPVAAAPKPQPEAPAQPKEHFCPEHGVSFKQYRRGNSTWYAHKTSDGKWCREK